MTAAGTITAGDFNTAGNATAAFFFGNGSNLTGVNATDNTKVAKAGDTMTGQLTLSGSSLTVTGASGAAVVVRMTVRAPAFAASRTK